MTVSDGKVRSLVPASTQILDGEDVFDAQGATLFGGITDVHVHLREPGFEHKETIASGTAAAAKGGVTTVLAMPNLEPSPCDRAGLTRELEAIRKGASVRVLPYGTVTVGEKGKQLSDVESIAGDVVAFTDDGRGYTDMRLLEQAMSICSGLGKIICSHAEAEGLGFSAEAEYVAVERELELAKKTGCRYHFCHLSTARSFELVREAKKAGMDVTCEVTPHHLFLCDDDIRGTNFKMNPPLRKRRDMEASLAALLDGTADMIATDHAPHTEAEKAQSYELAPNGIIGLETLLPTTYTYLVERGLLGLSDLTRLLVEAPSMRFNVPFCAFQPGDCADFSLVDFETTRQYSADEILSKSKNSPFVGCALSGFPVATFVGGSKVYEAHNFRRIK